MYVLLLQSSFRLSSFLINLIFFVERFDGHLPPILFCISSRQIKAIKQMISQLVTQCLSVRFHNQLLQSIEN